MGASRRHAAFFTAVKRGGASYALTRLLSTDANKSDDAIDPEIVDEESESEAVTADQVFAAAAMVYEKGDLEAARKLFQETLAMDPNHARTHLLLGVMAEKEGNTAEATDLFYKAAKNPDAPVDVQADALANVGVLDLDGGRATSAMQIFRRVLEIDPSHPLAHSQLGLHYYYRSKFEEAHGYLTNACRAKNVTPHLLAVLAKTKMQLDDLEDAEPLLLRALKMDPDFTPAMVSLASIYASGNTEAALKKSIGLLEKALRIEPRNSSAMANLGSLLWLRRGNPERARTMYLEALELDPQNVEILCGLAHLEKNAFLRLDKAKEFFNRAVAIDPDHPMVAHVRDNFK